MICLTPVPGRVEGGGQPVLSFEQCFILFSSFPLLLAFVVRGLRFEFCVFVAGWRHALRSEWPFIIIIIMSYSICTYFVILGGNLFRASCVCTLKLFKHGDHGGSVHFAFWFVIRRKV